MNYRPSFSSFASFDHLIFHRSERLENFAIMSASIESILEIYNF